MALMNSVTFVVLKILRNLDSLQNSLNANNCWREAKFRTLFNVTSPLFSMYFQNMLFISCQTQFPRLQKMLVSHKTIFHKNEAAQLCVTTGTCKDICGYSLVYNFFIQLFPFKSYVFVADFSNAIQHVKESFPKGTSQIEIVPLHVIFHMTCS